MAVAVVTGGARGVGKAIAEALDAGGHRVAAVGRTAPDYRADVADVDGVERLRVLVEAELGPPGILVNAAGTFGPIALVQDADPAAWIRTVTVNLIGAYLTCRTFVPAMVEAGWGRVVNVSSAASLHRPARLTSAYGTSKAALNQFTRHLAAELEGTGVTANVIHPGDLKTDMFLDIKTQVEELGEGAAEYAQWVARVEGTGGDAIEKAGRLVLDIVAGDMSGRFLWIDDPLQAPVASWDDGGPRPIWVGE